MTGLSDLDRAAARRVARAGIVGATTVYDVYGALLCTPMTLLIQRGVSFDVYRSVFNAFVEMLYDDLARRAAGLPPVGSINELYESFVDRFGGDAQLAYHVSRIIGFGVAGVVEPGSELVTRGMLENLETMWNVYVDALR